MKNFFRNFLWGSITSLVFPVFSYGQTFERNAKESAENFIKRILPASDFVHYKMVENKFNSPGKKMVFFFKRIEKRGSMNDTGEVACMFVNILIPENETSKKYSLQTLKIACNEGFGITIDDAIVEKDKQKKSYISILFAQLNRKSTALLIKTYKTFHLKDAPENNFTIEEVKE